MIEIVPMNRSHIDGMVVVEEQCFNSGYARKTFEKEIENKIAIYFAAVKEEKVVGYVGLWDICGTAEIIDVAVHRDYRRQGVAKRLLEAMIGECESRGIFEVNLEVRESNFAARELYRKLGFLENGLRKKYYENKETAILMQKKLLKGEADEDTCN
ncbi:MAG: ribosomal protein S18-alanine N-acetyltransferase [Clostridia bacterium]|nr:ribosomal protein S18-alanine N-acetyltransferase [Clostridia bacterium]